MLPETSPRRISFMLTPLIDVIFLLLIFFMLSSQIAPYSFLPLGGVVAGKRSGAGLEEAEGPAALPVVVRVAHGQVRIGNETMAITNLEAAARRHVRQGSDTYLLIPSASATVQDIVWVLDGLKAAAAKSVTLLNPQRGQP